MGEINDVKKTLKPFEFNQEMVRDDTDHVLDIGYPQASGEENFKNSYSKIMEAIKSDPGQIDQDVFKKFIKARSTVIIVKNANFCYNYQKRLTDADLRKLTARFTITLNGSANST